MRRFFHLSLIAATVAAATSCGDVVRQDRAPVLLIINSLQGAPTGGFGSGTFTNTLFSDVEVLRTSPAPCSATSPCPTTFADLGQVSLTTSLKNVSLAPTTNNQVTITRYRVDYVRTDGRNTPGVDVPYGFDGGVTGSITVGGIVSLSFELVRHSAKDEAPLAQLKANGNVIHTTARVTFYGHDAVGNDISVTGSLTVDFGNFGD